MNDYDKDQDYSRRTSDEAKKYQLEADGGEGGHGEPIANYELHHQTKNESDAASSEFELEQEAGVSRIEALCGFRSHHVYRCLQSYWWLLLAIFVSRHRLWIRLEALGSLHVSPNTPKRIPLHPVADIISLLYSALGLFCYANSLEGNTTYNYQQFAVSSFGAHPLLSTINILTSIMGGVIKPFVSKVSSLLRLSVLVPSGRCHWPETTFVFDLFDFDQIADLFSRPSALAGSVILLAIGMMVTAVSKDVHTVAAGSVLSTMGGTGVDVGQSTTSTHIL
jgi:hypothetical protein